MSLCEKHAYGPECIICERDGLKARISELEAQLADAICRIERLALQAGAAPSVGTRPHGSCSNCGVTICVAECTCETPCPFCRTRTVARSETALVSRATLQDWLSRLDDSANAPDHRGADHVRYELRTLLTGSVAEEAPKRHCHRCDDEVDDDGSVIIFCSANCERAFERTPKRSTP